MVDPLVREADLLVLEQLVRRVVGLKEQITYKPQTGFRVIIKGICVFIQHWQMLADCCGNETPERQAGRKFYVSPYMTDEEILRTFALAVKVFEEHEANEWLRFDGERILNPHPEGTRPEI